MNVKPHELGPSRPVSEMAILAAVERAQRHESHVYNGDIAKHLGFMPGSASTRRIRPQLEPLRADRSLAAERRKRLDLWALTARGRGRLAAARRRGAVKPLPESPQHRTWRQAREEAVNRLEEICGSVLEALEEADEILGGSESPPGDSTRHFAVGKRLERQFWRLGVAVHCLHEWPEPDDARRDVDPEAGRNARRHFYGLKESRS